MLVLVKSLEMILAMEMGLKLGSECDLFIWKSMCERVSRSLRFGEFGRNIQIPRLKGCEMLQGEF